MPKLSLYPLKLEDALGAALKTGRAPKHDTYADFRRDAIATLRGIPVLCLYEGLQRALKGNQRACAPVLDVCPKCRAPSREFVRNRRFLDVPAPLTCVVLRGDQATVPPPVPAKQQARKKKTSSVPLSHRRPRR